MLYILCAAIPTRRDRSADEMYDSHWYRDRHGSVFAYNDITVCRPRDMWKSTYYGAGHH